MTATLFALIVALLLLFNPPMVTPLFNETVLAASMVVSAALTIILLALAHTTSWGALQKVEQKLTSRLLSLYNADGTIKLLNNWLILFALATFIMAGIRSSWAIVAWVVMLGITFDVFTHLYRRIASYIDPFSIVKHLNVKAREAIESKEHGDLCHWLEVEGEIATKAVEQSLPTLCNAGIDAMYQLIRDYLASAKSISHHLEEAKIDQVSYTLFFLFQQLEQLHRCALDKEMESVTSKLVTTLGKIAIAAAHYDLTITDYPLHYLGTFAASAQKKGNQEVAEKATCTLIEVGKAVIEEVDIQYQNLALPFSKLLTQLDVIAKERFRQDKTTNLALLTQPFEEIKALFQKMDKAAEHQDCTTITAQIDHILSRFEQLQLVMKTIPPIPNVEEPEASQSELTP